MRNLIKLTIVALCLTALSGCRFEFEFGRTPSSKIETQVDSDSQVAGRYHQRTRTGDFFRKVKA
jgi:hypothetical protein